MLSYTYIHHCARDSLAVHVTPINTDTYPHKRACVAECLLTSHRAPRPPFPRHAGLTWLSVAGAQASSDQTFPLLFTFFSGLRHLELTGVKNFTARSLPSVLQLQALTCLDIRSTQATADAAAVRTLVKLPNCRRLMLSVAGDEGYGRHQWLPEVTSSRGAGAGAAAAAGGGGWHYDTSTTDSSAGEGLEAYACLRELGRAQSLRQLVLGGSTPTLTEYCRSLLPPWIDVR